MSRAGVSGPIGATVFYFILEGFRVGVIMTTFIILIKGYGVGIELK